jgi:methyl-accepting chemotaxis protein
MSKSQENTPRQHATRIISLGFAVVITLMLVLAATTLMRLDRIRESIREISEDHTVHAQLAHRMYDASRERAFLLFKGVHEDDPFLADKLAMRFSELAAEFSQARQALMKQHLASAEMMLLKKQGKAAEETMLQQDLVLGLVFVGNQAKAQETLAKHALPAQEGVLSAIDLLIKLQHREVERASKRAAEQQREAYLLLLIGTAVVTLLSGGIAYYVQRNMSRLMHTLSDKS